MIKFQRLKTLKSLPEFYCFLLKPKNEGGKKECNHADFLLELLRFFFQLNGNQAWEGVGCSDGGGGEGAGGGKDGLGGVGDGGGVGEAGQGLEGAGDWIDGVGGAGGGGDMGGEELELSR